MVLFIPFRNECDLMKEGETVEVAFNFHIGSNVNLSEHHEKLHALLKAQTAVKKINEAREKEGVAAPPAEEDAFFFRGEAKAAMEDVFHLNELHTETVEDHVAKLNADQLRIFTNINDHLCHQQLHENGKCSCTIHKPLHEFDETAGKVKWTKRASSELEKLNKDCNMTAGLEAELKLAVGVRVMIRWNLDTSQGLVNGALGITVQLQNTTVDIIEAYALINATKEVYQKERERRWRKDLRPTATSLLTSVPAIICARHVENDNAIEVYGEDLPSPELVPQKIIQWKLRYEKLPTDKRPSTVAAAIKECDPHYFPNIRIPQFTSSLWAWLPPP
ncbi:hypothetical protein EMCRGX_G024553 [Ephydatia muelleri]